MAYDVDLYLFKTKVPPDRDMIDSILTIFRSGSTVVVIDRDAVFSRSHISSAIMHASRSILRGSSRAKAESLEVLRWLSGSHQVSKGIEIASPNKDTTHILVLRMADGWPGENEGAELPNVMEGTWKGPVPEGFESIHPPFDLGEDEALVRMGLKFEDVLSFEEKEKMVLEAVCFPGLK